MFGQTERCDVTAKGAPIETLARSGLVQYLSCDVSVFYTYFPVGADQPRATGPCRPGIELLLGPK
jgi:hypothetical protein